ncbi:MAG: MBL fold metallo-hydrolase, partial [Firmicutes bacterium]|nr:MBL fold metallo-hydrolase [Bacillota bacterium]
MDLGQLDYLKVLVLAENTARPGTNFWGQHGASFLLQAQRGSVKQAILVDVGQSPSVLRHNMDEFGIAPSEVDAVVITHCHYDHTGGIAAFLEKTGKENIPVVGHPDIFRLNFRTVPHLKCRGTDLKDQPSEIEKHGGRLFLTKDPLQLMPGLLTTGEVPRVVGFEQPEDTFFTIRQGRIEEDGLEDDVSVV